MWTSWEKREPWTQNFPGLTAEVLRSELLPHMETFTTSSLPSPGPGHSLRGGRSLTSSLLHSPPEFIQGWAAALLPHGPLLLFQYKQVCGPLSPFLLALARPSWLIEQAGQSSQTHKAQLPRGEAQRTHCLSIQTCSYLGVGDHFLSHRKQTALWAFHAHLDSLDHNHLSKSKQSTQCFSSWGTTGGLNVFLEFVHAIQIFF